MINTDERVSLKPLTEEHAERLFAWRNDPFIANLGSLQRQVTWEEHLLWVTETIKKEERAAYIIYIDANAAGQVRFDFDMTDNSYCTISIYLVQEFLGKGLGVKAILKSCDEIFKQDEKKQRVLAHVRIDNERAAQGFLRAGFIEYPKTTVKGHRTFAVYNLVEKAVPHNKLTFDGKEVENVTRVVSGGYWAGGKEVETLEKTIAEICNKKYAVAVGSGLAALRLSLLALNAGKGKEVLIPAYSCVALPNAVLAIRGKPIPVDITSGDYNISAEEALKLKTESSAAMIAVDTFGYPAEFEKLRKTQLPIIEDCSHGFGNGYIGTLGDISIVSFYATKFIGGGEGGVVITNRPDVYEAVKDFRDYSDKKPSAFRLNDKLSDVHAAIINAQLAKLPLLVEKRRALAHQYLNRLNLMLDKFPGLELPLDHPHRIWYRFVLSFNDLKFKAHVLKQLADKKISACSPVENWNGTEIEKYAAAKKAYESILSIPLYPMLSFDTQQYILNTLEQALITFFHG